MEAAENLVARIEVGIPRRGHQKGLLVGTLIVGTMWCFAAAD